MSEYSYNVKISFEGLFKIYAESEWEAVDKIKNFDLYDLSKKAPIISYKIEKEKK
tara:strand:+ start:352 stop:516 length:165 start_codon:yes stop_codon:yes gene_type:complete